MLQLQGFTTFLRKRGVIGLAIGFTLGAAVQQVVTALVDDLVNPLVGLLLVNSADLRTASFAIGDSQFLWGDFVATTIDFVIVAAVVYFGFKALRLDRVDEKEE